MAKAALGRGLGQLLEASRVAAPIDGNSVEDRPPTRLGPGVRSLLTPGPAAVGSTVESTVPAESAVALDSRRIVPSLTLALLAADALLCLLAGFILCHPATRGSVIICGLCTAAIATGAWLACEAFLRGAADSTRR